MFCIASPTSLLRELIARLHDIPKSVRYTNRTCSASACARAPRIIFGTATPPVAWGYMTLTYGYSFESSQVLRFGTASLRRPISEVQNSAAARWTYLNTLGVASTFFGALFPLRSASRVST